MELKTERLRLVPLGMKYLDSTHSYKSDVENTKYMVYLPADSVEETEQFLRKVDKEWCKAKPKFYEFAVIYEGHHVGGVSAYFKDEPDTVSLGWIIRKEYWKRGFATESAGALISYLSENRGVTHFIAYCDSENVGSYNVMEKLGMKRVGEYGGRKNRSSDEERREYRYELHL